MINLNEVRFGNFFESIVPLSGSYAEKQRVKGNIFSVNHNSMFDLNFMKFLRPIELTEDWLLKFRFIFDSSDNNSLKIKENISICVIFGGGKSDHAAIVFGEKFLKDTVYLFVPCKSVHQLQNLFFALTGNELECKL